MDGSALPVKRKRKKTDAYVHIGTTEEYADGMSDKDRRELECEKVRAVQTLATCLEPAVCMMCAAMRWADATGKRVAMTVSTVQSRALLRRACYPSQQTR